MKQKNPTVHIYEEAIRQNIAKKDWQKLSEVMIGAEKVGEKCQVGDGKQVDDSYVPLQIWVKT